MQYLSIDEIKKHNTPQDAWVCINGEVFDVTKFFAVHPGGKLQNYTESIKPIFQLEMSDQEGSGIPYGDSNSTQGWHSPYYDETHVILRKAVRKFCQEKLQPFVHEWEETKTIPNEMVKEVGNQGIIALLMGFTVWPEKYYQNKTICGVHLEKPDIFHELILTQELVSIGNCSIASALSSSNVIGLPPIYYFGSDMLKEKCISSVLRGEKRICLAITEPNAGSDVAGIKCKAELSKDGKFYTVNGMKKWITCGIFSDFFTTAVVTDPEQGMFGLSLLLIERDMPGVKLKRMNQQGLWATGTTFIVFDNVKVPIENLIGNENEGFKYIMMNFNHERLFICMLAQAASRKTYETTMIYVHERETFGKKLIEHTQIRSYMGRMINEVNLSMALLEQCCYNYQLMKYKQKLQILPATIALLKVQVGKTCEIVHNLAAQIFGGNMYTRGGKGQNIEVGYREVKSAVILGGSEEIMADLGIKMAMRQMPQL